MIGAGILLVHLFVRTQLLDIDYFKPDLVFVTTIFFALRRGGLTGLWAGFLGGLLLDVQLGEEDGINGEKYYKLGLHMLSYSVVGYTVGKFGRNLYNESILSVAITAFILTLLARAFVYFLYTFFFHATANYTFLPEAAYNFILAVPFFYILSWVYRMYSSEVHE